MTQFLKTMVRDLPASFCFQPDGQLRERVRRAADMQVVKVIAGPEKCHVIIDMQRPYTQGLVK